MASNSPVLCSISDGTTPAHVYARRDNVWGTAYTTVLAGPDYDYAIGFVGDFADPVQAALFRARAAGLAHTEDGASWTEDNDGVFTDIADLARDPTTGDLYAIDDDGIINKSTDNGATFASFQAAPTGGSWLVGSIGVANDRVWFEENLTSSGEHKFWRIDTDGTDLTQLTFGATITNIGLAGMHAYEPSGRVWAYGGNVTDGQFAFRIDQTTGVITELTGPTLTDSYRFAGLVSLSATVALAFLYAFDEDADPNGRIYRSTDDGASWTLIVDSALLAGVSAGVGFNKLIAPCPGDADRVIVPGAMPGYYETEDSGATWTRKTVPSVPRGTELSWTSAGWADLAIVPLVLPGIARHARVGAGRLWFSAT